MVALPGFNKPGRTPASATLFAVGALLLLSGLALHGAYGAELRVKLGGLNAPCGELQRP